MEAAGTSGEDEMIRSDALQEHIQSTLIPTCRSRYCTVMCEIKYHLVPLGLEISRGALYLDRDACGPAPKSVVDGNARSVAVFGGYFVYSLLPLRLELTAEELASRALQKYNLKFAHGNMFFVEGSAGSARRWGPDEG